MQFVHTVHCVIFNNFYNQRCNWYLFCLLSLLLKKMLLVLSSVPIVKQQFNNINENIKGINIKNCRYYFFHERINIENFDSNLLKIDKESYKNIGIYQIGYITIKKIC